MTAFNDAYSHLNPAQKQAVDQIDGPVLVVAGPGTGKTQLLSARVANILLKTDTPARNILCLTFTESGAANMRERLSQLIGKDAYDVQINTYHAFGSDIISRFPDYFLERRLDRAIDELGRRRILTDIVETLDRSNPLKQLQHHIGDLIGTIQEVKRALLSSDDLHRTADENLRFIQFASVHVTDIFADFTSMPRTVVKAQPYFDALQSAIADQAGELASLANSELGQALDKAAETAKTTPLTAWKNDWLDKDGDNHFRIKGELDNRRMHALADVIEKYNTALAEAGLFDFDDMILESIRALQQNDELRYTLHEQYLYILLDEFQDTNAAQLELVKQLTNNPVYEGRPNVLAVGDDDQAIYAFQGAQYSNMVDFYKTYRDTAVVNLTQNYRSVPAVLETAGKVAGQIAERLDPRYTGQTKRLEAANSKLPPAHLERREFTSPLSERTWIAHEIRRLTESGVPGKKIAVLAPKHKYLEPLVAYLHDQAVPVSYEKRENILEAAVVRQIIVMGRLTAALAHGDELADELWPQVLSYDFWDIPLETVWKISWQIRSEKLDWAETLLDHTDPRVQRAARLLLFTATKIETDGYETILDYLIGSSVLTAGADTVSSPLRDYYTSEQMQAVQPELFLTTISHLSVLRARLHDYAQTLDSSLMLPDVLAFVDLYRDAGQPLLNTSPYAQSDDAVQLMTVFKSKGLEFQHVFLISCNDDVWGGSSRGNSNKLTLPPNLKRIRHAGATDDERLRLFFVAITRAQYGLYLTNSRGNFTGKPANRLKYLEETEQPNGGIISSVLPEQYQQVIIDQSDAPGTTAHELDWRSRHVDALSDISLKDILLARLTDYQISASDVLSYIDVEYAGPQSFYFNRLLQFPSATGLDGLFGTAIHRSLEWYQRRRMNDVPTTHAEVLKRFDELLDGLSLPSVQAGVSRRRGHEALSAYLAARGPLFEQPGVIVEKDFRTENVWCGPAHLAGRVDRMEVDTKNKTICVVDYKTGGSHSVWESSAKLYKYRLQLYLYKLLIEGSRTYNGYRVTTGRLEFVEPDSDGRINSLEVAFTDKETEASKQLLEAVWRRVQELDFPLTDMYAASIGGIKAFVADILAQ